VPLATLGLLHVTNSRNQVVANVGDGGLQFARLAMPLSLRDDICAYGLKYHYCSVSDPSPASLMRLRLPYRFKSGTNAKQSRATADI
jgi:hypothetical protein